MILNQTVEVLDQHPAPERGELEDKLVKIPKNNFNKNENYSLSMLCCLSFLYFYFMSGFILNK